MTPPPCRLSISIACLLALFISQISSAQATKPSNEKLDIETAKASVTKEAEALSEAILTKNFEKIADATYPAALKSMGGRANAIAMMKKALDKPEYPIKSVEFDRVAQLVETGPRAYAIVPESLKMVVPGGVATQQSFILGISDDRGKTWTFIDGAAGDPAIKSLLPNLPASLTIPKRPKPVVTPDVSFEGAANPLPTTMPVELANLDPLAAKWVSSFKGKTEAEVTQALGDKCTRSDWKSNSFSGLKLKYNVSASGSLTLMFNDGKVVLAYLEFEP